MEHRKESAWVTERLGSNATEVGTEVTVGAGAEEGMETGWNRGETAEEAMDATKLGAGRTEGKEGKDGNESSP